MRRYFSDADMRSIIRQDCEERDRRPDTVRLRRSDTCWLATFSGPRAVILGMDGETIPTPFTAQADEHTVVAAIYANNPGARVVVDLGPVY